jgi:chromosome partitioning protein
MALRIAVANHKGGVAKSTTTMMVVEGLGLHHGLRVLAIDMDPQASLSTMLLSREGADQAAANGRSLAQLLEQLAAGQRLHISKVLTTKASDLVELRDAGDFRRVDLIASSRHLLADLSLIEGRLRDRYDTRLDVAIAAALAPELERISKSYDVVVFDCPAGTGPLALAAIRLARLVLAPTVLDTVSLTALGDFLRIILEHDLALADNLTLKVLPTLYQANDPEQRLILDRIRSRTSKLDAIHRPVPATVHIRRAIERIRPDSYRHARQKYSAAMPELEALADTMAGILRNLEGLQ